jgi:serine protease Do
MPVYFGIGANRLIRAPGLVFLVVVCLICLAAGSRGAPKTNLPPKLIIEDAPLSHEVKAATSFAPMIKRIAPSVVNIYSTVTVRERANPMFNDPLFRRFFGEDQNDENRSRKRREQSLGSGVIVSSDGYILTANHVVEGAEKVKVALASGEREFAAQIIGTDPPTDTALLKVDGKDLPAATLGDSDKLEVGDVVLAIGNPFAVGQTVTMGIVSGLGRGGFGINAYENFIQTDAAINTGNSGGALVDAQGRLMGINTWIISSSGGSQGLGFAVPINLARFVMDRLTKEGKVRRAYLGLRLQPDMTPELVRQFKLPNFNGALVTEVEPDSPGAKAGFKDGDFVIEFNGRQVKNMEQFRLMVSESASGTKVSVKILRDGAEKTLTATLAAMPDQMLARGGRTQPNDRGQSDMDSLDGVEVSDLDARTRRENDFPADLKGAVVSNVDQDSNAAEAGLRQGDVILEIDRHAVHSADEAVTSSEKAKGDHILLRIWRRESGGGRGGTLYLSVDNVKRK